MGNKIRRKQDRIEEEIKVPFGVKVVSVLYFICAGFLILAGLIPPSPDTLAYIDPIVNVFSSLLLFLFAGFDILLGIKLRKGKNWARMIILVLSWISAIILAITIVGAIIPAIIVYHLQFNDECLNFFEEKNRSRRWR